jgi:hypothetical protein
MCLHNTVAGRAYPEHLQQLLHVQRMQCQDYSS